jgi:hypothetical protein
VGAASSQPERLIINHKEKEKLDRVLAVKSSE